eukprot:6438001-Amphidinium_carterae.1
MSFGGTVRSKAQALLEEAKTFLGFHDHFRISLNQKCVQIQEDYQQNTHATVPMRRSVPREQGAAAAHLAARLVLLPSMLHMERLSTGPGALPAWKVKMNPRVCGVPIEAKKLLLSAVEAIPKRATREMTDGTHALLGHRSTGVRATLRSTLLHPESVAAVNSIIGQLFPWFQYTSFAVVESRYAFPHFDMHNH